MKDFEYEGINSNSLTYYSVIDTLRNYVIMRGYLEIFSNNIIFLAAMLLHFPTAFP